MHVFTSFTVVVRYFFFSIIKRDFKREEENEAETGKNVRAQFDVDCWFCRLLYSICACLYFMTKYNVYCVLLVDC